MFLRSIAHFSVKYGFHYERALKIRVKKGELLRTVLIIYSSDSFEYYGALNFPSFNLKSNRNCYGEEFQLKLPNRNYFVTRRPTVMYQLRSREFYLKAAPQNGDKAIVLYFRFFQIMTEL